MATKSMKGFEDVIQRLYALRRFGVKLGLERITTLVNKLGNPHLQYDTIHVGGTNGKGSVCRILGSVLTEAGYTTGVYTSPHLSHFRERITVDDVAISDDDLSQMIKEITMFVSETNEKGSPTFFEVVTTLAFEYFRRRKVDVAVIEVGLGGRHDATNIIQPMLTILTDISLDHRELLGETVEEIAEEKAGILKEGVPLVTSANGKALEVVKRVAREKNVDVTVVDENSWKRVEKSEKRQRFIVHGELRDYETETSLLGLYQGENIAVAVIAAERLQMNGFYLPEDSIEKGVELAVNPGRMEVVARKPCILLDGAHNPAAMHKLVECLREDFEYDRLIVVLGILRDKDVQLMVEEMVPFSSVLIATKARSERACNPDVIVRYARESNPGCMIEVEENVDKAIVKAKEIASDNDLICVTGSLCTVGEARDYLIKNLQKG